MSALQDREMERLSDLFAEGTLRNAQEIASLLSIEFSEQDDRTVRLLFEYRERPNKTAPVY